MDSAVRERFEAKFEPEPNTGCWLWTASTNRPVPHGYGAFRYGARSISAHRVSYEMYVGPIPDGIQVCHHCDVRLCVNPAHLFLGTQGDNIRDAKQKDRLVSAQSLKTHCKRGHPFSRENTYSPPGPSQVRVCRECARTRAKEWARKDRRARR